MDSLVNREMFLFMKYLLANLGHVGFKIFCQLLKLGDLFRS